MTRRLLLCNQISVWLANVAVGELLKVDKHGLFGLLYCFERRQKCLKVFPHITVTLLIVEIILLLNFLSSDHWLVTLLGERFCEIGYKNRLFWRTLLTQHLLITFDVTRDKFVRLLFAQTPRLGLFLAILLDFEQLLLLGYGVRSFLRGEHNQKEFNCVNFCFYSIFIVRSIYSPHWTFSC